MKFSFSPESLSRIPGLDIFQAHYPDRIGAEGTWVSFEPGRVEPGLSISRKGNGLQVNYQRSSDAFRALGLLLAGVAETSQDRAFESVGVMWDMSRNAVLQERSLEELFRKFALMGIDSVQLYLEDLFALPGEPFFGYGRGVFSSEDLRRIDSYARQLGIEVVAGIQTLGHLEQLAQWPAYQSYFDVNGILMVGDEKVRKLIGKMLDAVSASFQSRIIHIGMDEAVGVGTGKYLRKNGYERPFDILNRHLKMVVEMCEARGLRPMIWSDMYFRIGSATNDYYDWEAVIPEDVISQVPAGVDLVYWDYYHEDASFYQEWIRRHRAMGKEPVFAAGAWTWNRFWAYAPKWRSTLAAGMDAARKEKIGRALLTVWGDDGAEFHPESVLPAVQYFAEWAYSPAPDDAALDRQYAAISPGVSMATYQRASALDLPPSDSGVRDFTSNYAKWVLWHDPILGFLNGHLPPGLAGNYRRLADELDQAGADEAVQFAVRIARAVGPKAELLENARKAWLARDLAELERLRASVLPECVEAVRELWKVHRAIWRKWNKPFGWEVLDRRYAGCIARLESLGLLLDECLENPDASIAEWEFVPVPLHDNPADAFFSHGRVVTPSVDKW